MRAFAICLITVAFANSVCRGGEAREPSPPAEKKTARPKFQSLRYEEDYSVLADPARRDDFWDPIKYVPIAGGRWGYLSFGGEVRERFEAYENEFFRNDPDADNAYLLQRYLFHADYHPTDWLRFFGQMQGVFEDGRTGDPRPTDRGGNDIHQLFSDITLHPAEDTKLTLRLGRQEMSYGTERLISAREGTNARRSFDAARILFEAGDVNVDAFISSPVEIDDDSFDDQEIRGVRFWGVYGTTPIKKQPGTNLDFYYLGLRDPDASFSQGEGKEERHTLGLRHFGKVGSFDFNTELFFQFGRFGPGEIRAWSIATDQGITFEKVWGSPRLGFKAAIATGDEDANDADLQTFNPLFPRGNYFTEASLLGPSNFIAIRPRVTMRPMEKVTFDMGMDLFWRENRNDGIYTPGGGIVYRGNPEFSRWVGSDVSIILTWQANRHLTISGSYAHFFAEDFIRQNGGRDVDFVAVWAAFKF